MRIGIPAETTPGERRVALTPDAARRLTGAGHTVVIESGAGVQASFPDEAYREAGADVGGADQAWQAEVVAKVAPPRPEELSRLRPGSLLVGFLAPLSDPEGVRALAGTGVTAIAMESIPRISRAQSMDALSSRVASVEDLSRLCAAARGRP